MLDTTACIVIRGAGNLASGVALQLWRAGLRRIVLLETAHPLAVRRRVSFSEAVYVGACRVEEVPCRLVQAEPNDSHVAAACATVWLMDAVAALVDPDMVCLTSIAPTVLIDATSAKHPTRLSRDFAPLVLALGPGHTAGQHAHAVIETQRGPTLGAIIRTGEALPNTDAPAPVEGMSLERALRTPVDGVFRSELDIGAQVRAEDCVGQIVRPDLPPLPFVATIDGVVRGLLRDNTPVAKGTKLGDIDPHRDASCVRVSDRALAVGAGVLEAIRTLSAGSATSRGY